MRAVPQSARRCGPLHAGTPRSPIPVSAMPWRSAFSAGERAARPSRVPDARRLYALSCNDSRVEFQRRLFAVKEGGMRLWKLLSDSFLLSLVVAGLLAGQ